MPTPTQNEIIDALQQLADLGQELKIIPKPVDSWVGYTAWKIMNSGIPIPVA